VSGFSFCFDLFTLYGFTRLEPEFLGFPEPEEQAEIAFITDYLNLLSVTLGRLSIGLRHYT
jgi:hypothetical protein